ncbi:hypothetical protein BV22DRAFT_1052234, partial [Leucogyrophana mollusca]
HKRARVVARSKTSHRPATKKDENKTSDNQRRHKRSGHKATKSSSVSQPPSKRRRRRGVDPVSSDNSVDSTSSLSGESSDSEDSESSTDGEHEVSLDPSSHEDAYDDSEWSNGADSGEDEGDYEDCSDGGATSHRERIVLTDQPDASLTDGQDGGDDILPVIVAGKREPVQTGDREAVTVDGEDGPDNGVTNKSLRKSTRARKLTDKAAVAQQVKKVFPLTVVTDYPSANIAAAPIQDDTVVDRDVLLKHTYTELVPLRKVSLVAQGDVGRTYVLSAWKEKNHMEGDALAFVQALFAFKQFGDYVNLSRIDPRRLTLKLSGKSSYVAHAGGGGMNTATCSHVGRPTATSSGGVRKEISGYFHAQEFERFAGALGAIVHQTELWANAPNSSMVFNTLAAPTSGSTSGGTDVSSFPSPVKAKPSPSSGYFSTVLSPATSSSSVKKNVLPWDSVGCTVPVYDYRREKDFDPAVHLQPGLYGTTIPSHLDIPVDSLALVAYTVSIYNRSVGSPPKGIGCNIMWAALLGAPAGSSLPSPPLPGPTLDSPSRGKDSPPISNDCACLWLRIVLAQHVADDHHGADQPMALWCPMGDACEGNKWIDKRIESGSILTVL